MTRATIHTTTRATAAAPTLQQDTADYSTLAQATLPAASELRGAAQRLALVILRCLPQAPALGAAAPVPTPITTLAPKRRGSPSRRGSRTSLTVAFEALGGRLRPLIRRTDALVITHEGIAVLLRDPASTGAQIVAQRLRDSLATLLATPPTAAPILGIGHVTLDATSGLLCADDDATLAAATPQTSASAATIAIDEAAFAARFANLFAQAWAACALAPIIAITDDDGEASQAHDTLPATTDAPASNARLTRTPNAAAARVRLHLVGAHAPHANAVKAINTTETNDTERTKESILRQQAAALGVPFARLPTPLPVNCRRVISRALAGELRAIPIGYARATLTVAMEHPCDTLAVQRLRQTTGLTIFPVLGATDEISHALLQLAR